MERGKKHGVTGGRELEGLIFDVCSCLADWEEHLCQVWISLSDLY